MRREYNFSAGSAGLTLMSVHKDLHDKARLTAELYRAIDKRDFYANVDALVDFMSDLERRWG